MDEGDLESEYTIDLAEQTEKVDFEFLYGGITHVYQAEKNLKTGETKVLVDEEDDGVCDDEEDY